MATPVVVCDACFPVDGDPRDGMDGSSAPPASCMSHPRPSQLWGVCVIGWCHMSSP